jgi:type II secretory pathway pseudopilin PulG
MIRHPLPKTAATRSLTGAFTLVEVLVASGIMALMVLALASVLGSVTNLSSQASSRLDAVRLGREVFDLFNRDLSQAVITRRPLGTSGPLQFCVNPAQIGAAYRNASAVFWQSAISRDRTSGNLAVVGYFVQKTAPNRAQLRRVLIEPTDALYEIYSKPNDWLPATTFDQFVAASGSSASNKEDRGWAADGVLGLWIRCLDANGEIITKNGAGTVQNYSFDSRAGYRSGSSTNGFVYSTFNALPAFVDVGLICVAPRDVERIDRIPDIAAVSPLNFDPEMTSFLDQFSAGNPRVKTATRLTRRLRIYGVH